MSRNKHVLGFVGPLACTALSASTFNNNNYDVSSEDGVIGRQ